MGLSVPPEEFGAVPLKTHPGATAAAAATFRESPRKRRREIRCLGMVRASA
jgi:hypothetical protein